MLAREHSAQVILASVIDDAMPEEITKALAAQAEEMLRRSAGFLGRDTSHSVVVRVGHPATEMIALAAELSPDLVVLGTHRDRSFLAALHETTAQRIVRLTDRSVLVVADPADHPYDQIVAATDFSPGAMTALRAGHRLAPKAKITPVHMLQIPYSGMLGTSSDASRSLEQSFRNDASEANLRLRGLAAGRARNRRNLAHSWGAWPSRRPPKPAWIPRYRPDACANHRPPCRQTLTRLPFVQTPPIGGA
jgi:hypothetical protein